ncbi:MAG: MMPL family transporter [Planctomycetaceae bacterium]|nr:MMPL family transporter [Planctomycetaceae bacterium]
MFERLGRFVSRWPLPIAAAWIVVSIVTHATSPDWSRVAQQGEFAFLPADSLSREAEELYRQAFHPPEAAAEAGNNARQDILGSNVVIVVQREDLAEGLTEADFQFISSVLNPGLQAIRITTGPGFATGDQSAYVHDFLRGVVDDLQSAGDPLEMEEVAAAVHQNAGDSEDAPRVLPAEEMIASGVWTYAAKPIGPLLISHDKKSTLLVVQVEAEFLDRKHMLLLERIEGFLNDVTQHRADYPESLRVPANLDLAISGSATVGRDMLDAEKKSTQNTELYTKVLVIVLLLLIYRAPMLVVIPLMTVGLTTDLTIALLRHMAIAGWINVFSGLEIYVTVVVYGAGVDFCLFLISRYKEGLDAGATFGDAVVDSISKVGLALACSAGTSIAGIGMMMFAQFGKFPQAGFSISFGLFIVLCCALTFTPALLRLTQRFAFWPDVRRERISPQEGWIPESSPLAFLSRSPRWTKQLWEWVAGVIERRPGTVFVTTVALMTPFAIVGVLNYNRLSYGLLTELPPDVTSVVGAEAVKDHFPAGMTGVTSVLLKNDDFKLAGRAGVSRGEQLAREITNRLMDRASELGLADVRSQSAPLGTTRADDMPDDIASKGVARNLAQREYVSTSGPLSGKVMRLDLVFDVDPFTPETISRLTHAEAAVRTALRDIAGSVEEGDSKAELYQSLPDMTQVRMLGATASLRDLKKVTDRDRVLIAILVTVAVYFVLITLLGRPAISLYLIATVLFSFLVTLGVTHAVFWLRAPATYSGVDWKAPIFVFTILVAMGEDYNVLLMARVDEEQRIHGPAKGVLVALMRTGSIISSCGIIMAGTFASLMTGTLMGIIQLGFALAFGVLLDTFVVRPILVPSYLVLLYQGGFGRFGRWLGYAELPPPIPAGSMESHSSGPSGPHRHPEPETPAGTSQPTGEDRQGQ